MKNIFLVVILLLFNSCTIVPPELRWESVNSDQEPLLNILGIISQDSLMPSFIRVHRSLNLQEAQDTLVRDTVDGLINIKLASRSVIKNAEVILSSNGIDYSFEYRNIDINDKEEVSYGAYFYNGDDFIPLEGETYNLSVSTPSGLTATGQTTIPNTPKINKTMLPDTFQVNQSLQITFEPMKDFAQIINIGNFLDLLWKEIYFYSGPTGSCGLTQEGIMYPGESFWEYHREICGSDVNQGFWKEDWLMIQIMSMDDNYYDYFIKNEDQNSDFSNLFIGQGGYARNFGIKGGIGVFGSIGIDRSIIPVIP